MSRRHGFNPWSKKIPQATKQPSLSTTTIESVPRTRELPLLKAREPESPRSAIRDATPKRSPCTYATREKPQLSKTGEKPAATKTQHSQKINK